MLEADEIPKNSWAFSHCKSFTVAVKLLILNLPSNHLFVFLLKRQSSDAPDEDVCDYRELPKSGLCRSATVSISEKELCLAAGLACQQWSGCSAA